MLSDTPNGRLALFGVNEKRFCWRGSYSEPDVLGKRVILIDDGVATVSTMRAAVRALKAQHPARVVVAVPTVAGSAYPELRVWQAPGRNSNRL